MGIIIKNQQPKVLPLARLKTAGRKILKHLAKADWELSVLFCDDEFITELNARYLNRIGPTNVISFSQTEEAEAPASKTGKTPGKKVAAGQAAAAPAPLLGDVVISVDTAIREAALGGQTEEDYLVELLLHGILHLVGYDHELGAAEEIAMDNARQEILAVLAGSGKGR